MSQNPFGDQQFNPYDSPQSMPKQPMRGGSQTNVLAIISLVLGIISCVAALIACCGYVTSIPGLICGGIALQKPHGRGMAIAGLIISAIGFILSIISSIIGVMFQMNR